MLTLDNKAASGARRLSTALLVAIALVAGCRKEPSRWDKAAATPPAKIQPAVPEQEGSAFNKAFPADGVEGYKRVFTQEKTGFAEAKLQKDGKEVATLAIADVGADAAATAKFSKSTEALAGHPLVTVGKNQSALLVKGRYQVKVSSPTLGAEVRKQLLGTFNLAALSAL
jgi:hypothetical protein